ncbi:hypothetical protein [Vibrio europaeus]|uniref:hypothetical protein n=1 Tax=Vibrio europaeus TaxID=300876 RepID=UPI0039DF974C
MREQASPYGKLENWKTGKLENWKTGKLENWKTGKLENWKTGKLENWKTGKFLRVGISCQTFLFSIHNVVIPESELGISCNKSKAKIDSLLTPSSLHGMTEAIEVYESVYSIPLGTSY